MCWFLLRPGQLYGLEKFWAFLKYSRMKNQPIDPKLQEHLRQFKNLEDFRVVVSVQAVIVEPFCPLGPTKLQLQLTLTPLPPCAAPDGRGWRQEEVSLIFSWR